MSLILTPLLDQNYHSSGGTKAQEGNVSHVTEVTYKAPKPEMRDTSGNERYKQDLDPCLLWRARAKAA